MLEFTEYTKFLIGLLSKVDLLGVIPVFLALPYHQTEEQRYRTARLTVLSVFAVLMVSLPDGEWILWGFGISFDAFRFTAAFVMLIMGLSMLKSRRHTAEEIGAAHVETIVLVLLTMRLLAGPGAMSAVIVYAHQSSSVVHYLAVT